MLQMNQLALRRGGRLLFDEVSVQIHAGQKVGVTGANGTGKSSLFGLIRGELQADAGECRLPGNWVIASVVQEMPAEDRPAIDLVLDGDTGLRRIEAALVDAERAGDGLRQADLHARLETIGGYSARSRAARLLHGLGFMPGEEDRPARIFSGGWRMRLHLARALMCRSDLLLLDEPTNHLDLDAVIWLEEWLTSYPGTLLLISHDREFLDNVCGHILHLERQSVSLYTGNYSRFECIRSELLANQQAGYVKQQRAIAHMQSFVARFRAKATKARQAQSRLKALERMELIAPAHVDSPFRFSLVAAEQLPDPLLELRGVATGYDGTALLSGIEFRLAPGDRVGLLGPNGAGKSTFIKLLAGVAPTLAGDLQTVADLRVGYFAQHQLEQLDATASPLLHLQRLDGNAREQQLRNHLGGFGFGGDQVSAAVGNFSGGEKSRLVLALLTYQRPNLLLLDEPTNHLDLEMRQALAEALQDFAGAVVLVSHDRHLLSVCCDRLVLVNDGHVADYQDSLEEYPQWLAAWRARRFPESTAGVPQLVSRKAQRQLAAEQRRKLQPLTSKLAVIENRMRSLEQDKARLEEHLGDPQVYLDSQKERLLTLLGERAEIDQQIEREERAWLQLSEELEALLACQAGA